jgi:thiamine monophosphate synthase
VIAARVMIVSTGEDVGEPIDGAMIQLRAKTIGAAELDRRARSLVDRGWVVSINMGNMGGAAIDARAVGAAYVHLPEAAPIEAAADREFGRSVHSVAAAAEARRQGCAYLVAGPVWPTEGKPAGIGLDALEAIARAAAGVPVFAIGGILGPSRVRSAIARGAHGVAGIRAFTREQAELFVRVIAGLDKRS